MLLLLRFFVITIKETNNIKLIALLLVGILAVSSSAIWIRLAMQAANNYTWEFSLFLAGSRLLISALMLLPFSYKFRLGKTNFSTFLAAAIAGLCLAIHFASWVSSLAFTSITASTTLVTTTPIWVALYSRFFRQEKLNKTTLIGIGISFVGGIIIAFAGATSNPHSDNPFFGNGLALLGAIMVSFYLLLSNKAQQAGLSIGNFVLVAYSTAAVFLLPVLIILQISYKIDYKAYNPQVYLYVVLMAVVCQLIGHTSFNWALQSISPTFVALIVLLEPIIAGTMGVFVFGEIPPIQTIYGGCVLILGIILAIVGKNN